MDEQKWIAVLDCNNFFVSCERLFRPDLKKRPVMVLSSNDGCVVARSQEVKDMSIPMGIPAFQIKDIIKDNAITTFSSNFTLYRDISRRVMGVLKEHLNVIDQYSIDESFFEMRGDETAVLHQAQKIKDIIEQAVGIPVSIGVAATKTRAKYANTLAKKGSGVVVLGDARWRELAPTIAIATIWGVGRQLSARFTKYQLPTVWSVMESSQTRIEALFGVVGLRVWHELRGEPVYFVSAQREASKSIMSSRSFAQITMTRGVLDDALFYHVEQAAHEARAQGLCAGSVRVWIYTSRYSEQSGAGGSSERICTVPTAATPVIIAHAMQLLTELYKPHTPYKKLGVELGRLSAAGETQQLSWFGHDAEDEIESTVVSGVVDGINNKYKSGGVQYGRVRTAGVWQSRSDFCSPSYTTNWSDIPIIGV